MMIVLFNEIHIEGETKMSKLFSVEVCINVGIATKNEKIGEQLTDELSKAIKQATTTVLRKFDEDPNTLIMPIVGCRVELSKFQEEDNDDTTNKVENSVDISNVVPFSSTKH